MMAIIAALGLVFTVSLPLVREGPPPCMTAVQTGRWLVSNPGVVRCADCHARPVTARLGDLPAIEPGPGVLPSHR
jgi:hypothetical protein